MPRRDLTSATATARRPGRHRRSVLAVAALTLGPAVVPAVAASAAGVSVGSPDTCQTVHIGPSLAPDAAVSSYFRLDAGPGSTRTQTLLVANPATVSCGVTLLPAYGKTAVNAGDTYVALGAGQPCVAASCWLQGLPQTVSVPPGSRVLVTFTVSVPAGAASGQYLAGVVGEPASPPPTPATPSGQDQQGQLGASVVARVAIGVAITVPGSLHPLLTIPAVTLAPGGLLVSDLDVTAANAGNTWERPRGGITVTYDRGDHQVPVRSSTILPGDRATVSVPVGRIPGGPHPVVVALAYDGGAKTAYWRGVIAFPTPPVVRVGHGTITLVTPSSLPAWAVIAMIVMGALLALLLALLLVFLARRRRDTEPPAGAGGAADGSAGTVGPTPPPRVPETQSGH
ncbi:MAG TPA: hypothetical protein VKG43_01440 [Acidimicrobiales bacterium]|nr:hypothetical protein [Acidimicrobiales bacterium]